MELQTLTLKVDASQAIGPVEQLTRAMDRQVKQARQTETAAQRTEAQLRKLGLAEIAAYREAERMAAAQAKAARSTEQVAQAATRTEAQVRRLQLAEVAAYREAERMAAAQQKAAQQTAALGAQASVTGQAIAALGLTFGAASFVRGAVALGDLADRATLLNARLAQVTTGTGNLRAVQDALFASAQRTRTSYEDMATLFVRVARNGETLRKSQADLLRFTELVSMQLQIAGTASSEASAGVLQLSQALAKGRLDGDEFRSVMENMPTVADALAASLGVTKGALYALASEGKITGATIVDAMLAVEQQTRTAFERMPQTIGGALTKVKNDLLRTVGEIDRGLGASTFFGRVLAAAPGAIGQAVNGLTGGGAGAIGGFLRGRGAAAGAVNDRAFVGTGTLSAFPTLPGDAEAARRTAWEEARRQAAERARWEEQALARANALAAARLRAEMPGLAAPGAGVISMGGRVVGGAGLPAGGLRPTTPTPLGPRSPEQVQAMERARAALEANAQIAANFRENLSRATGDIFATFLREGTLSVRGLVSTFADLGASTIGNALSSVLSQKLSGLGTGGSLVAGAGLMVVGGLLEGLGAAARELRGFRDAVANAGRATSAWLREAGMVGLSPAERELAALQGRRTTSAQDIVGQSRFRNTDLTFENFERDFAEFQRRIAAMPASQYRERQDGEQVIAELRKVQQAFAANLEAARRASLLETSTRVGDYARGLNLSAASPLSVTAQLREARERYATLLRRADSGDQGAADQLTGAADSFLALSRQVNASGGRYAADFNTVKADALRIEALFRDRANVAEETRDAAQDTADNTERGNEIAAEGFDAIRAELAEMRRAIDDMVRFQREIAENAV